MDDRVCLVLITTPQDIASQSLAQTLVEEGLAACVTQVGPVRSTYLWKGEVCSEQENLLLVKTTRKSYPRLQERVVALHSYEVPEIIALPTEEGFGPYMQWVFDSIKG